MSQQDFHSINVTKNKCSFCGICTLKYLCQGKKKKKKVNQCEAKCIIHQNFSLNRVIGFLSMFNISLNTPIMPYQTKFHSFASKRPGIISSLYTDCIMKLKLIQMLALHNFPLCQNCFHTTGKSRPESERLCNKCAVRMFCFHSCQYQTTSLSCSPAALT